MYFPVANTIFQTNDRVAYVQQLNDIVLGASPGAGQTGPTLDLTYEIKGREPFLWFGAVAQSTGKFQVKINFGWEGRDFSNDWVRSSCFFGSAQQPFLHVPKWCPKAGELNLQLQDLSGAGNTVRLTFLGGRARPEDEARWGLNRGLFLLATPSAKGNAGGISVAANSTSSDSRKLSNAYSLRCQAITADQTSAAWKGNFTYKDPRNQEKIDYGTNLMDSRLWTGTNLLPHRPAVAPVFAAGTSVDTDFLDLSGSTNVLFVTYVCEALPDLNPATWGD